jgi:phosphatidylcholine synthase
MDIRFKALFVHLLTATGSILSMLAMLSAVEGKWSLMFLWLVLALIVDGVDGPLARRYDTVANWPLYDGVLMDLIVDYLTYVFIPAYALIAKGMVVGWMGYLVILVLIYGSVIYFSDTRMKTKDKSFAGFPACWNMVVLVFFTLDPPQGVILVIIIALSAAMFLNLKFIHPTRTPRWHRVNLAAAILWLACATQAAWVDFNEGTLVHWGLIISSLYLTFAGIAQQVIPEKPTDRIR